MKVLVYKSDNDGFKCPNCGHKIELNIGEAPYTYYVTEENKKMDII